MSFNHRPSTDIEMCSALKILVFFALVFATTASANERSKRSGLIDLGTSVLLPWESLNNGGLRNKIYGTVPNSEILRVRNIDNQNLNGRDELQQIRQRELVRISNELNNRNKYQARGAVNVDSIQDSQSQYSNGRYGQSELQQQIGYSGVGAYSTSNFNPSIDEEQVLSGEGQRQSQYSNQAGSYRFNQQNLDGGDAQSNAQSNKIISLESQLYKNINQGQRSRLLRPSINEGILSQGVINSNRLKQLSGLGVGLSGGNVQQKDILGYSPAQVNHAGLDLNQEGLRNSGRLVSSNKLEQNIGQADAALNEYWLRQNQEPVDQVNIQQNDQDSIQQSNYGNNAGRYHQLLRVNGNQQLYRPVQLPVAEQLFSGNTNEQYPRNAGWNSQRQSAQINDDVQYRQQLRADNSNLGSNLELLASQPQNQESVNQQQPNVYTYKELSAKIWNVIKSNPSMISNLGNLREQLLNQNNSGNKQVGQLKALLQEARNRNIVIPRNNKVGQSSEEQGRNAVVNNLIDALNKNSNPLNSRDQISFGGW